VAELTTAGLDAVAVEGAVKQFDVIADGSLVYSKQREGRFPEHGETLTLIQGA
jgi:predicted Rdx family selenoprotein